MINAIANAIGRNRIINGTSVTQGFSTLKNNSTYYNLKNSTGADAAIITGGNNGFKDLGYRALNLSPINNPTIRKQQGIPALGGTGAKGASLGVNGNTLLRSSFEAWVYFQPNDGQPAGALFLFGHLAPSNPGCYIVLLDAPNIGKIAINYGNPTDGFVVKISDTAVFADGVVGAGLFRFVVNFEADTVDIYKNGSIVASSFLTSGGGQSSLTPINPLNYSGPNNLYLGAINNNGTASNNATAISIFDFAITPLLTVGQAADLTAYFLTVYIGLGLGQSNDEGQAEAQRMLLLSPYTTRTPEGCFVYPKLTRTVADDGTWQALNAGTNNRGPETIGGGTYDVFGDETPLMVETHRITEGICLWVKTSRGGSRLEPEVGVLDWAVSTNELYLQATQYWWTVAKNKFLTAFPAAILKPYINWHQGENDAIDATSRTNYPANILTFFTALRAYDPLLAAAPLFITLLHFWDDANEAVINAALTGYVATDANSYLINISDTPRKMDLTTPQKGGIAATTSGGDDQHTSWVGQIAKATRKIAKMRQIGYL